MARSTARQVVMQLLYERLSGGDTDAEAQGWVIEQLRDREDIDLSRQGLSKDDRQYVDEIVSGVTAHQQELDELIEHNADGWTIDRMPRVDLSILRLAAYELGYCEKTPDSVCVSEALLLADKFSEPKSKRFINGVLGSIARSREA